jgi:NAD(P)-dependent dehydrogenase (short-subunit alcohol dehydrogenase family)
MRALVTGAASGLGRALATALAARGGTVCALDRDAPGLATLPLSTEQIAADLADRPGRPALAARLAAVGPFDAVLHVAGISATGRFEAIDPAAHAAVIEVNLTAPIVLTDTLIARGALAPGASLVFVASLSHRTGYPGAAVYAASKDGLVAYAEALAASPEARGLHVLTVLPGPLDTPHAARHAPPGASRRGRMDPDRAARAILARLGTRGTLTPGLGPAALGLLGRLAPGLATELMRRALYRPLAGGTR